MKAYLVGKAVNIEYLVGDFCGESVRVSSINEMDWEKFQSSDVVFCLFGEFEKPKDYEKRVVSVQLFGPDQAQEIALKSEAPPEDVFYLPFECDKKDIEDLWVMLLAVLSKEELDKDVEGVAEYLKETGQADPADLTSPTAITTDALDSLNSIKNDDENIELEVDDVDLDEQEVLSMSSEDDELDIELGDDSVDIDADTDVDFDIGAEDSEDALTSEVVDLDFSADDEIEVDDESSGIFMTGEGDDDDDLSGGEALEFGDDDLDDGTGEIEAEGSLDIDLGTSDGEDIDLSGDEELVDMDRTGDFQLSDEEADTGEFEVALGNEDDDDVGGDVLEFTGGDTDDDSAEMDFGGDDSNEHIEMDFSTSDDGDDDFDLGSEDDFDVEEADDVDLSITDAGESADDISLDFSDSDDDETDATMIANDLDALKAEALAKRDGLSSGVEDGESIEAEDGFVLETYDDDEMEEESDFEVEEDTGLDFSGMEDDDDSGIGIDLSGGNDGASETVTTFQSGDDDSGAIDLSSGDEVDFSSGDEMDFSGGMDDDDDLFSGGAPAIPSEPPMVRSNEVLNFGGVSDEKDLMNMHSTIREIREERQEFLNRIQQLEALNKTLKQENLTMRAELDEKRIELNVIQKRQVADREDLREKLRLSEEKKLLFEEKLRRIEREYEKLEQRIHIDVEKVRKRERELENQLELVRMDAQSQIKTRDTKIMDLKRKIDSLEFNVKTSANREQKNLEEKLRLETRMEKVMDQLRSSIRLLEEEVSVEDIKKIESH